MRGKPSQSAIMLAYTRKGGKKTLSSFFSLSSSPLDSFKRETNTYQGIYKSWNLIGEHLIEASAFGIIKRLLSLSLSYALTKTWPPARPAVFFFLSLSSLLSLLSFSRSRSLAKFRFGNLSKNWNLLTKKPPQRFQEKTKKKREIIENSRLFRVSRLFR